MPDNLTRLAEDAVKMALEAGADDAWTTATRSREVSLTWRDQALETVQESTSQGLSLAIYADGRYSTHTTSDLRPQHLAAFVSDAVELTRALEEDPHRAIPDPSLFEGRPEVDLELHDPGLDDVNAATRERWCRETVEAASDHPQLISATAQSSDTTGDAAMASSNGFSGRTRSTSIWLSTSVTVQDEGDKRPEGFSYHGARKLGDMAAPVALGGDALARTVARLGAEQGPTGRMVMVVDPRATSRLLNALIGPATGRSIQQGRSFWAGKLGEQVASDLLTLVDDPLIPRGLGSRLFDGEGISSRRLPLVEAGVARSIYVDTYYGRKLSMDPTTGSPSNVVVALGIEGLEALLASVDRGVYVTGWLGGNSDSTTGDFSLGIQGHMVEAGQVGTPVGEMNVTGNLVSLFQSLVAVGNDPWSSSRILSPTMVFDGVQFSGA